MLIIPAIDIKNGKCVRLTQGNFESEIIYSEDLVDMAKQWENQGAEMLHIVDLDGAKSGDLVNFETIKKIVKEIKIPIQVGGGIRNKESVKKLHSIGIERIILGTVCLEDEDELKNILKEFSSVVAIALDTKNGKLMKQGWFEASDKNTVSTALRLEKLGVKRFIYTDIIRDGTLTEPNYEEISNLINSIDAKVIASGGISDIASVKKLHSIGTEGVIIGKALYEKKIDLKEALDVS